MHIKTIKDSVGNVYLPRSFMEKYLLKDHVYLTLKVGSWMRKVRCKPEDQTKDVIGISQDISDEINLPENLSYEVFIHNGELYIGPVLGLLVSRKEKYLTPKRLEHYLKYVEGYPELQGLIIAFTFEGIMDEEKRVIGYAYEPDSRSWKRGTFVLPGAVYIRRAYIKLKTHNRLLNLIGDRFFNSYAFDKWEMWQWLSSLDETREYLPETVLLSDSLNVEKLLEKHRKIFVKPKRGYRGSGIYTVEKKLQEIVLQYRKDKSYISYVFMSLQDLHRYLFNNLMPTEYIAQQMLDLIKVDDRLVDLRVIVQKNRYGKWQVQGIVSRQGPKQSIVSNVSQGGAAQSAWNTLVGYYENKEDVCFRKWVEIEKLVLESCLQLEKMGFRYGNLGFDIAIDTSDKLWIIEINNIYPDHTIALDADDPLLYRTVMKVPLLYAKWLSGFRK